MDETGTDPSVSRTTDPGSSPTTVEEAPRREGGSVAAVAMLATPRATHTATLLADGRVLVAGGCSTDGCGGTEPARTSEVFDPRDDRFIAGPAMQLPRAGHTATRLADGRVLIVGGYPGEGEPPHAAAELYDPASERFVEAGVMSNRRGAHTATSLDDGRVLVVGGVDESGRRLASVELYDPVTGAFTPGASLPEPRAAHAAAKLADGRVVVTGGESNERGVVLASTLLYDPASDGWVPTGDLITARYKHAVLAVPGGGAVVIGGSSARDFAGRLASIEVLDPSTGRWSAVGDLARPRFKIPAAVASIADGRVLVLGDAPVPEVFDPRNGEITLVSGEVTPALFATATALADGRVLLAGGYDDEISVVAVAYVYRP